MTNTEKYYVEKYYTEEQQAILNLKYLYSKGYVTRWQFKKIAKKITKYLSKGQYNKLKEIMLEDD